MASIWKLPVIFVCENNQFATEVAFEYSSSNPHVGRRAELYGIAGFEVDGNNAKDVHSVAGEAIHRARKGDGATLIECKTHKQVVELAREWGFEIGRRWGENDD